MLIQQRVRGAKRSNRGEQSIIPLAEPEGVVCGAREGGDPRKSSSTMKIVGLASFEIVMVHRRHGFLGL